MELSNEFVIDRPVEETWKILNDLEFIAPCMPGAQLQEIEGDEYRGIVKIKVGPITAQYKGKASFVEQDAVNKVARLKAEGRDPRQGNANAMVTAKMEAASDTSTTVNIHTDLGLSGKIASFGRGAIEDVSKKILGQFTDNLRDKLAEGATATADAAGDAADTATAGDTATAAAGAATAAAGAATATASNGAADAAAAADDKPKVRKIDSAEPEPVDLLSVTTGDSTIKKAAPLVVGGALLLLVLRWVLGGGSDE